MSDTFYHGSQIPTDGIHGIVSGEFANAAARLAALGFTVELETGPAVIPWNATDKWKTAVDLDTGDLHVIANPLPSPTWVKINNLAATSVFGNDEQFVIDPGRITTGSTVFQTATTLTTPGGLNGVYRVAWGATIDHNNTGDAVQAQFVQDPAGTPVVLSPVFEYEPKDSRNRMFVGGVVRVTLTGSAETFAIQYRQQRGNTAGIQGRYIEFWRIS